MHRFEGKTVLVAGAAAGTGEAIARRFASEGAAIAVCDIDEEKLATFSVLLRSEGFDVLERRVDVTEGAQLEIYVKEAAAHFGKLDVLVNNVGGGPFGNVEVISPEDWRRTMVITLLH